MGENFKTLNGTSVLCCALLTSLMLIRVCVDDIYYSEMITNEVTDLQVVFKMADGARWVSGVQLVQVVSERLLLLPQ